MSNSEVKATESNDDEVDEVEEESANCPFCSMSLRYLCGLAVEMHVEECEASHKLPSFADDIHVTHRQRPHYSLPADDNPNMVAADAERGEDDQQTKQLEGQAETLWTPSKPRAPKRIKSCSATAFDLSNEGDDASGVVCIESDHDDARDVPAQTLQDAEQGGDRFASVILIPETPSSGRP
eukprot:1225671-Rhodomonas_salina.2